MHRRTLFALPLLLASLPAAARPAVSEIRVGATEARARRMQARLGIPVRAVRSGLVEALNAGHLELALLTPPELAEARHRMGTRLLALPGTVDGRIPVTRRVLPPPLREHLANALA